jgi:anti-repressor protein
VDKQLPIIEHQNQRVLLTAQLVFVENGRVVTDSLMVAEVFKKSHDHVIRDIRQQLVKLHEANEAEWGVTNFGETQYQNHQNGQWYPKYNMTEDAFVIVAMSYVTPEAMKMKIRFLDEFRHMKELLSKPRELTRMELIQLALEAERENVTLRAQAELDKPKVIFADAVSTSDDSILIRELAKLLRQNGINIGEKRLFEELRERGFLIKQIGSDRNSPTQRAMDMGLFRIKETSVVHSDGKVTISTTPKVTGKGQVYFVNLFKSEMEVVTNG